MALIYYPKIFKQFSEVRAGHTLRGSARLPYGFNMSVDVGDDTEQVLNNRNRFATTLGFPVEGLATQQQVHGDRVRFVKPGYKQGESDALMSIETEKLLAVSVADCICILLYDSQNRAVAAVHSGWRGSEKGICVKAIDGLASEFGTRPDRLYAYVGPSAGQCCYEVGEDVASAFNPRYRRTGAAPGKYMFDNKGVVLDQLRASGIPSQQIEVDMRCTICNPNFHSYRRDGGVSGRMYGAIGLTGGTG